MAGFSLLVEMNEDFSRITGANRVLIVIEAVYHPLVQPNTLLTEPIFGHYQYILWTLMITADFQFRSLSYGSTALIAL